MYPDNPALANSSFAMNGLYGATYMENNFNDFSSALVTLFELMVVNNWFITMDGVMDATNSHWPMIYFVSFWYVAVVTVLNLVVASFIDGFSNLYEDPEEQQPQSDDDTDLEDAESEGAESTSQTHGVEFESKSHVDADPEGEVLAPDDPLVDGVDPDDLHAGSRTNNDEAAAVVAGANADNSKELDLSSNH